MCCLLTWVHVVKVTKLCSNQQMHDNRFYKIATTRFTIDHILGMQIWTVSSTANNQGSRVFSGRMNKAVLEDKGLAIYEGNSAFLERKV